MKIPVNPMAPNRNVAVIINFRNGTFDQGFQVIARVLNHCIVVEQRNPIHIPAVPELRQLYEDWKKSYLAQSQAIVRSSVQNRAIDLPPAQIHHASDRECRDAADKLLTYLGDQWFNSLQFQTLKEWIKGRTLALQDPSVPIFFEFETEIQAQDILLRRLPWSSWDLFRELPYAEATLGLAYAQPMPSCLKKIKVLAVFGSDEGGIQLETDRQFVSNLQQFGAEIYDLSRPEPQDLYLAIAQNTYDILFFAGHSFSEDNQRGGELLLKPGTTVSIDDLLPSLQVAVTKGLKLAIFNSCDGLGLANQLLTQAKIPAVVVFREPVPDEVARRFLQDFLQAFSQGTPLFLSARKARDQLRFLEKRSQHPLPCASWLPVVCQNPSQSELVWQPDEPDRDEKQEETDEQQNQEEDRSRNLPLKIGTALLAIVLLSYIIPKIRPTSKLLSRGNQLILTLETNDAKELGISEYTKGNWEAAITAFRKSLNQELLENQASQVKDALDPETLIYLNNAIAEKKADRQFGQLSNLAITVPATDKKSEQLLSKEFLQGAALRQAEFNCGVDKLVTAIADLNKPLDCQSEDEKNFIHLTIANDRSDEKIAKQVAIKLSNTSILGVVGHFSSASCLQTGKIYEKHKIVNISPTCTSTKLSGFSDYFFRTVPNDAIAAQSLWDRVGQNEAKVAIAYSRNSEYPESFKTAFEKQLIAQKYTQICDDLNDNFYAPGCAKEAKAKGANFLLIVPTTTDTLNAALSILPNLEEGIVPLGSDSVYSPATLEGYGQAAAESGLQIYVSWHPSSNPNNRTNFETNATQLFDFKDWNWHSQSSYDAISALAQGIRELEGDLSGKKLMQTIRSPEFAADGVAGKGSVKFLENGDRDLTGFEDKIGAIVRVEKYQDEMGEIRYRFQRVEE
jgi:branched-chain amino acid transport system substrate-binding protein